jgi:hypothetical protein
MDPSMNYRHSQVHTAELHRRAELHRLAAKARATDRDAIPTRPSLLASPTVMERARVAMGRLRHRRAATKPARP